jgi:predicted nucleic acid-binding protein
MERQVTFIEARELLDHFTQMKGHSFWPERIGFNKATEPVRARIHGYRQVTDAYLLGLAIHEKGTLVTLDKSIRHLAGNEFAKHVLLIGESAGENA